MATSPVVLPVAPVVQLNTSFPAAPVVKVSLLQHLGGFFKRLLHLGEVAAVIAEPIIATAFPNIAPLYHSAIGLAIAEEATAAAATGTGAQKLANVVAKGWPQAVEFLTANNINMNQDQYTKWVSAVVDSLNLVPAPKA